ncbi:monooxygenase [Nocardiopsis gilva YIM 90087]|uniref:Monooxygenase n=2 Tax=Nocardiopsis gilva TaxID=280236 RepID=A0A223S4G4_9ACTN|nr:flavin reductase family protein [Nocardiopsis gilva]ASU83008.1 monooxygenase [Nocardiopsis gilva YIM 90087]
MAVEVADGFDRGFDTRRLRDTLGRFATGIVAITGRDPTTGAPAGLAANSFTSVSLEPPLVGFCVAHTSSSWPVLRTSCGQVVNVLGADQEGVCRQMAAKGGDKFAGLDIIPSPRGNPVLTGALAWLECDVVAEHVAGDHLIVVARVHQLRLGDDAGPGPLVFYRGTYGGFRPADRSAPDAPVFSRSARPPYR